MWATSMRQEKVKANYWLDTEKEKKKKNLHLVISHFNLD